MKLSDKLADRIKEPSTLIGLYMLYTAASGGVSMDLITFQQTLEAIVGIVAILLPEASAVKKKLEESL